MSTNKNLLNLVYKRFVTYFYYTTNLKKLNCYASNKYIFIKFKKGRNL